MQIARPLRGVSAAIKKSKHGFASSPRRNASELSLLRRMELDIQCCCCFQRRGSSGIVVFDEAISEMKEKYAQVLT